jgi:hypothetical protein
MLLELIKCPLLNFNIFILFNIFLVVSENALLLFFSMLNPDGLYVYVLPVLALVLAADNPELL